MFKSIINSTRRFIGNAFFSTYIPDRVYSEIDQNGISKIGEVGGPVHERPRNAYVYQDEAKYYTMYDALKEYSTHPLTIISHFLGLPNRPICKERSPDSIGRYYKQSLLNLFYNFIGWQPEAQGRTRTFNFVRIPFIILWHLFKMPFRAALNIVKLATELLPLSFCLAAEDTGKACNQYITSNELDEKYMLANIFRLAKFAAYCLAFTIRYTLLFLGRAATSPTKQIWAILNNRTLKDYGDLGELLAFMGAVFSVIVTMCIYSILLAVAAPFIASHILPFAAAHLPAGIVNAVSGAAQAIGSTPLIMTLGNSLQTFATTLIHYMSLAIIPTTVLQSGLAMSSAAVSGFGALMTLVPLQTCVVVYGIISQANVTKPTSSKKDMTSTSESTYGSTNLATLKEGKISAPSSSNATAPSPHPGRGLFNLPLTSSSSSSRVHSSYNPRPRDEKGRPLPRNPKWPEPYNPLSAAGQLHKF